MNYKIVLAIIASIISIVSYIPYIRDILKNQTKPHIFSWFLWALLTGIAFIAQLIEGGGVGAWVTGTAAVMCLVITILAFSRGEKHITLFDWICFIGAILGIAVWLTTENPLYAVIMVTIIDIVAFIPTYRKAFYKPQEETALTFALDSIRFILAIIALESLNLTTWLYPASVALTDGLFVVWLLVRRKQLDTK